MTNEFRLQSFRQRGTNEILELVVRLHPQFQQLIVLWSDIYEAFHGATKVYDGNKVITRALDSALRPIEPPCICYQEDKILEVVVKGEFSYSYSRFSPLTDPRPPDRVEQCAYPTPYENLTENSESKSAFADLFDQRTNFLAENSTCGSSVISRETMGQLGVPTETEASVDYDSSEETNMPIVIEENENIPEIPRLVEHTFQLQEAKQIEAVGPIKSSESASTMLDDNTPVTIAGPLLIAPSNDNNNSSLTNPQSTRAVELRESYLAQIFGVADQGDNDAQVALGNLYRDGHGDGKQDFSAAMTWYRKAADQGHALAQNNIGDMYYYGQGVVRSYETALFWYQKAAAQNNAVAQNKIGDLYYYGLGVEQDYLKALEWYKKAAKQGIVDAHNTIGGLYHQGHGVQQDFTMAMS
ncbi:hypothetical protein FBU30_010927 [Linnemannia zychae]|nr:hypothetical protein FBU30_010927 [Linnemannia zychae]